MIRFTTISGRIDLTARATSIENIGRRLAREMGINPDSDSVNTEVVYADARAADRSYSDYRYRISTPRGIHAGTVRVYNATTHS